MHHSLGATLCIFVFAFLTTSLVAAEPDLTGIYDCVGTSDQGGKYVGTVEIKKVRQGYKISWVVNKTKYDGIGFVDGQDFSVAWLLKTPQGAAIGVVHYKIKDDGSLDGKWTDPGLNGVYDERLTPRREPREV